VTQVWAAAIRSVVSASSQADVNSVPREINDAVMRFTDGRLSDDIAIIAFRLS